jgi:hypothetical protein
LTLSEKSKQSATKFRIETRVDNHRESKYLLATFASFLSKAKWRQGMKKLSISLPLALVLCFVAGCQDKEAMAELVCGSLSSGQHHGVLPYPGRENCRVVPGGRLSQPVPADRHGAQTEGAREIIYP